MDDSGGSTEPLNGAYGQVTDPERYRSLHQAAMEIIDRLVRSYDVVRHDDVDLGPQGTGSISDTSVSSLVPRGGGAPVIFEFTSFPGVHVRYGFAGSSAFPACGCDACNEQPEDEATRMAELVADVVAGGFTEVRRRRRLRADTYESKLVARDASGWSGASGPIESEQADLVPVGTTSWSPWRSVET